MIPRREWSFSEKKINIGFICIQDLMSLKGHKDGYINSTVGERKIACPIIVRYFSLTMRESIKILLLNS